MITRILRSFRSLAESLFVQTALDQAAARKAASVQNDAWLFEDEGAQLKLQSLPEYPGEAALTDGERHRLDMLDASLNALSERMERLRAFTRSAQEYADELRQSIAADRAVLVEASAVRQNEIRRVVDPVISEVLFGSETAQPELDGELFEIDAPARFDKMLPAYQISQIAYGSRTDVARTNRSGG